MASVDTGSSRSERSRLAAQPPEVSPNRLTFNRSQTDHVVHGEGVVELQMSCVTDRPTCVPTTRATEGFPASSATKHPSPVVGSPSLSRGRRSRLAALRLVGRVHAGSRV